MMCHVCWSTKLIFVFANIKTRPQGLFSYPQGLLLYVLVEDVSFCPWLCCWGTKVEYNLAGAWSLVILQQNNISISLTFVRRVFGVKSTGSDDWQGIFSGNCHDQQTLQYRLTFYWKIKVILCRNEHSGVAIFKSPGSSRTLSLTHIHVVSPHLFICEY